MPSMSHGRHRYLVEMVYGLYILRSRGRMSLSLGIIIYLRGFALLCTVERDLTMKSLKLLGTASRKPTELRR